MLRQDAVGDKAAESKDITFKRAGLFSEEFSRDFIHAFGSGGLRFHDSERPASFDGAFHGGVLEDGAEEATVEVEMFPRGLLETPRRVSGFPERFRLVDDEKRPKGGTCIVPSFECGFRVFPPALGRLPEMIEETFPIPRVVLENIIEEGSCYTAGFEGVADSAQKGVFEKDVSVAYRGRFRVHDKNSGIGEREEIENFLRTSGSEIEEDDGGGQARHLPHQFPTLLIIEISQDERGFLGSGDEIESRVTRGNDQVLDPFKGAVFDQVGKGAIGANPQDEIRIGKPDISVDEENALVVPVKDESGGDRQSHGDVRLPHATLSRRNRDQAKGFLFRGGGGSMGRSMCLLVFFQLFLKMCPARARDFTKTMKNSTHTKRINRWAPVRQWK